MGWRSGQRKRGQRRTEPVTMARRVSEPVGQTLSDCLTALSEALLPEPQATTAERRVLPLKLDFLSVLFVYW